MIAPRNSHEPNSRLTSTVCLPCQPIPAASASGFSISGAVSTNTFTSAPVHRLEQPGQFLELALDDVVIVAIARIDRDVADLRSLQVGHRVGIGPVVHPQHDHRARLAPQRLGRRAPLRRIGHPLHLAMPLAFERHSELFRQVRPRIGARNAEGVKAQGLGALARGRR